MDKHIKDAHEKSLTDRVKSYPIPNCCEAIKYSRVVYADCMKDTGTLRKKPIWRLYSPSIQDKEEYILNWMHHISLAKISATKFLDSVYQAHFCPHCATPLPDFQLKKKPPKPIYTPDGEDYCGTCNDRNMCCECLSPQAKWEIKNR